MFLHLSFEFIFQLFPITVIFALQTAVSKYEATKQKRKFSSFFKSLVIELDKDLYGPDNHLVEVSLFVSFNRIFTFPDVYTVFVFKINNFESVHFLLYIFLFILIVVKFV